MAAISRNRRVSGSRRYITGLDELLDANVGRELETASDVRPAKTAGMLIAHLAGLHG